MKEPKILSPEKLLHELKRWRMSHPRAIQLDGSTKNRSNPVAYCFVLFGGKTYRLHGDTKVSAIDRFIFKSSELGHPDLAFVVGKSRSGKPCLRLNDGNFKSKGWNCYHDARAIKQLMKLAA